MKAENINFKIMSSMLNYVLTSIEIKDKRPAWWHFSSFDMNLLLFDIFSGVT